MLPINIYELTRIDKMHTLQKLERQLSKRHYFLNIKNWEIEGLASLVSKMLSVQKDISLFDFYYSFQIPKLGKEFDLLRISEEMVINIELKSEYVSDEKIKKQLSQNRYYLASLGRTIRSYTYISSQGRLMRLTNGGHLIEVDISALCEDLFRQGVCKAEHIEQYFAEECFLISPLTDPEHFLRQEYFLTSQQHDIKRKIMQKIIEHATLFQGFTGMPGTGKTLLLYDLALILSEKDRVCVLHFGSYPKELIRLNDRLKRVDFYPCSDGHELPMFNDYKAVLVDEGHHMSREALKALREEAERLQLPVIISYDVEDVISPYEREGDIALEIEALPIFCQYKLTNRIRMNGELSSFIRGVLRLSHYKNKRTYPSVAVLYAANYAEARLMLARLKGEQYIYIREAYTDSARVSEQLEIDAKLATCKEFERVVMVIDETFYYDEEGYLRQKREQGEASGVRRLFHGMSRAKNKLTLIVVGNEIVFETILETL